MSVEKRVLLFGGIIILMTAGIFFAKGLAQFQEEINYRTQNTEQQQSQILSGIQKYLLEEYKIRIKGFVEIDKIFKEALISRNRAEAIKIASRKYQILKGENPYFNLLQFHLPSRKIFFRIKGQPEEYWGKRSMIEEARQTKGITAGFEIGKEGCLYRIVYPVFDGNLYIGALEFGIKTKQIINPLKDRLNSEVAVYFLSREWQTATNHPKTPLVTFGDFTLVSHNDKIYDQIAEQIMSIKLEPGNPADIDKQISHDDKTYIAHFSPVIKTFQGNIIGGVIILQDITSTLIKKKHYILYSLLSTSLILLLSLSLLYLGIKKLVGTLEHTKDELESSNLQLKEEIAKRVKAEKNLYELSIKDELTGLYNRRYFANEVIPHAFQCMCRHSTNFICLMLDLDDFKQINDKYGHQFGDLVLREFAEILIEGVRNLDVVSRYGGEEFIIILGDSSLEHGIATAERIRKAAETHVYKQDGIAINVTVSIGLASFFDHIDTEPKSHEKEKNSTLLRYSDQALYAAKKQGKNRLVVYDKSMRAASEKEQ